MCYNVNNIFKTASHKNDVPIKKCNVIQIQDSSKSDEKVPKYSNLVMSNQRKMQKGGDGLKFQIALLFNTLEDLQIFKKR